MRTLGVLEPGLKLHSSLPGAQQRGNFQARNEDEFASLRLQGRGGQFVYPKDDFPASDRARARQPAAWRCGASPDVLRANVSLLRRRMRRGDHGHGPVHALLPGLLRYLRGHGKAGDSPNRRERAGSSRDARAMRSSLRRVRRRMRTKRSRALQAVRADVPGMCSGLPRGGGKCRSLGRPGDDSQVTRQSKKRLDCFAKRALKKMG